VQSQRLRRRSQEEDQEKTWSQEMIEKATMLITEKQQNDYEVEEVKAKRVLDKETDGFLDFQEDEFLQSVVEKVTPGGLAERAGVKIGSRIISSGIFSQTYDAVLGDWKERPMTMVAFVLPEQREGGVALKEVMASVKPGGSLEAFTETLRRWCTGPNGKCRYSFAQIQAMWVDRCASKSRKRPRHALPDHASVEEYRHAHGQGCS